MSTLRSKRITTIFLLALVAMSLFSVLPGASAVYKQGKLMKTASVTYVDNEIVPLGTKWTYTVESGNGRAKIRSWKLHSHAFKYYDVVDSSGPVTQRGTHLKFTDPYDPDETRTVWFVLEDKYAPIELGRVNYVIYGSFAMPGKTQGPVMAWP